MNDSNKDLAFAPVRRIIQSGRLLGGGGGNIRDSKDYILVTDYNEALKISRLQDSSEYSSWRDFREAQASDVKGPSSARIEFRLAWEEDIFDEIEMALPRNFSESINDIESDLFNACSNIFFSTYNLFFDKMFEHYKNGFWPCGIKGDSFQNGKIVLFNSIP
jgi:hypothetical protein